MTEAVPNLFSPFKLAGYSLKNRIAMAPLTRQMAELDGTPTEEMAAYYARRARGGFGLIITEGTYEEDDAYGCKAYLSQPGIANAKHVAAWKNVADAIHENGSIAIMQLMHGGRVSDPRCLQGRQPVSASDGQSPGWILYTDNEDEKHLRGIKGDWPKVTFGPCRALSVAEIYEIAEGFAAGAKRAVEAGFDGVEIHGANGYLLYQFIHTTTNHRTDEFGGSAEKRVRFARLVIDKVRAAIGKDKIITLRLSQDGVDDFGGAWAGGVATAREIGAALRGAPIDAIHWSSFNYKDNRDPSSNVPMSTALREASGIPTIVNGGIDQGAAGEEAITSGAADMVAVGRPSFANPDWPQLVRSGRPAALVPFSRHYVIKPPIDASIAYPADYKAPEWPTTW